MCDTDFANDSCTDESKMILSMVRMDVHTVVIEAIC